MAPFKQNLDTTEQKRTHLIYLKKQHRDLDNGIITAYNRHTADGIISKLKLKKLSLISTAFPKKAFFVMGEF